MTTPEPHIIGKLRKQAETARELSILAAYDALRKECDDEHNRAVVAEAERDEAKALLMKAAAFELEALVDRDEARDAAGHDPIATAALGRIWSLLQHGDERDAGQTLSPEEVVALAKAAGESLRDVAKISEDFKSVRAMAHEMTIELVAMRAEVIGHRMTSLDAISPGRRVALPFVTMSNRQKP